MRYNIRILNYYYHYKQMSKNLWQVINRDDLLYHLKSGEGRIIVLTLTLIDTDESIKSILRKYIKRKSEQYPNINFLYYAVRKEDMGKVGSLVPKDLNYYPVVYHIYNVKKLLGAVPSLDKSDKKMKELDDSFKDLDEYYKEFDPNFETDTNNKSNKSHGSSSDSNITNQQNQTNNFNESNSEEEDLSNVNNNTTKMIQEVMNKMGTNRNQPSQIDKNTEKKKLAEKIIFIKKKWQDYELSFFDEIKKRKKEELKLKNKTKLQSSD